MATVNRMSFKGFITADDPSNPLPRASMTCTGNAIVAKDGRETNTWKGTWKSK